MAQYDILLTQNVHATLTEYSEKFVNVAKGGLVSAIADQTPTVLAGGTDGYVLARDDAETTGLKWIDPASITASFGTQYQIPYTNSGGDDFDYSANLTFDGTKLTLDGGVNLDIIGEYILLGSDISTYNARTDANTKYGFVASVHYTNSEEPFIAISGLSTASYNTVWIGGGTNDYNAASRIRFYAAATPTTLSGTEIARIDINGFLTDTIGELTAAAGVTINDEVYLPTIGGSGTGTSMIYYNRSTGELTYGDSTSVVYTFSNGITETGGAVTLGGNLTGDTVLNIGSSFLNFTGTNGSFVKISPAQFYAEVTDGTDLSYFDLQPSVLDVYVSDGTTNADFELYYSAAQLDLILNDSAFVITDNTGKGIQYPIDYSGTFVARSLVDRAYVDDAVAGLGDVSWGTATSKYIALGSSSGDIESSSELLFSTTSLIANLTIDHATYDARLSLDVGGSTHFYINADSTATHLSSLSPRLWINATGTDSSIIIGSSGHGTSWLTIKDHDSATPRANTMILLNSAGADTFVVQDDGGLLIPELGDDDTEDHVLAIDDSTGLVTKRSVASLGVGSGDVSWGTETGSQPVVYGANSGDIDSISSFSYNVTEKTLTIGGVGSGSAGGQLEMENNTTQYLKIFSDVANNARIQGMQTTASLLIYPAPNGGTMGIGASSWTDTFVTIKTVNTTTPEANVLKIHNSDESALFLFEENGVVSHEYEDATNTTAYPFELRRHTTTTPAGSLGVGMKFRLENLAGDLEDAGSIDTYWTDVSATTEDAYMAFNVFDNGSLQPGMVLRPNGILNVGTGTDQSMFLGGQGFNPAIYVFTGASSGGPHIFGFTGGIRANTTNTTYTPYYFSSGLGTISATYNSPFFYMNRSGVDLGYDVAGIMMDLYDSMSFVSGGLTGKTIRYRYGAEDMFALFPHVADGAGVVAYNFDTANTLSTAGAKLLALNNNSTLKFYVDYDGNAYAAGVLLTGGTGTTYWDRTSTLLTTDTAGDDIAVDAASKLYFDGGNDTYMHEPTADTLSVVVGSTTQMTFYAAPATDYAEINCNLTINGDLEVTGDTTGVGNYSVKVIPFDYTDHGTEITFGLAAGDVLWKFELYVETAFDGTSNQIRIGNSAHTDVYYKTTSDPGLTSTGWKTLTISNDPDRISGAEDIELQYYDGVPDATAGQAYLYIFYSKH